MKTTLDTRKENADILIEYANGGSFTVKVQNKSIQLKGRGVKEVYENGNIEVSSDLLTKLRVKHVVECNF